MNKNEAFSRVSVDALLANQGWSTTDTNAVRYEVVMDDSTRADCILCDRHSHSLLIEKMGDEAEYAASYKKPERFQSESFRLYRYASRLLLERVSWLCRDHHKEDEGDGTVEITFSNCSAMSYNDLLSYLGHLRTTSDAADVRVDWSVVRPELVKAVNHDQLAGENADPRFERPTLAGCRRCRRPLHSCACLRGLS